ncbi:MAG: hypothetical protein GTN62_11505 [Gemmatimonadales bacterium]|nr:hypothetical protein [Gemmatimonadales bacterium]NIN50721.1 hypothetical protein [Gemmatimonadales bacterium]NIP08185.1 hypothetical protein [Gemmatimonadales bacterium]NIR01063.1 hypothetical protein [Gemmatimonadales bacterium]NIS65142.1 hypothetical protein [Gemmatimonadales bacterium]
MIGFLQPLALLGLAAAAIPPLLHLMGRRLPPTVLFPAVQYLTATEREHSRRLKLRNLLLLLLRVAIILLIVLAVARPVARVGAGTAHPPTALALIVDNSLSSGAVVAGQRVLDVLMQRARHVLARTAAGDRLWLVLADGIPRRISRGEAAAVLDSLTPWPLRLDVAEAVRAGARAAAAAGLPVWEVVLLSDLQATAFSPGDPATARVLAWEPPEVPQNRGIDSAYAEPPVWSPEGAVVAHIGGSWEGAAAVRLAINGGDVARAVARPGDRAALAASGPRRGWLVASVQLDPDELRADDRWWLALQVADPAAVRAEPAVGRFVQEAVSVLQGGGRAREGSEVVLTDRPRDGVALVFPPHDPSLIGSVNRALAARGIGWRYGELVEGEWTLTGEVGPAEGAVIYRRYRMRGSGVVLARVGGEPWLVRAGNQVLVASRMEERWSALPISAAFIPFLDLLINRVAATESWTVQAAPGAAVVFPPGAEALLLWGGPAVIPGDGRLAAPLEPGVYLVRGTGGDTVGALEVNHDYRESQLAPASPRVVRATLGADAHVLGGQALDRELFGGARRAELTGLLIAAAILAAVAELALASVGRLKRRE